MSELTDEQILAWIAEQGLECECCAYGVDCNEYDQPCSYKDPPIDMTKAREIYNDIQRS